MTINQSLTSYITASALLTITPGLHTALVLRTAAVERKRSATLAAAGICAGCLSWGVAASIGIGAVLLASAFLYSAMRLIGAAYVVFLGCRLLLHSWRRSSIPRANEGDPRGDTRGDWFRPGLYTNLVNPKVGIFYIALLPQFIPDGVRPTSFSVLLASIHAIEGVLWFAALITATGSFLFWSHQQTVSQFIDRITGES